MNLKKLVLYTIIFSLLSQSAFAIEENLKTSPEKKTTFITKVKSIFKKDTTKKKKRRVEDITLPAVIQPNKRIPFNQLKVMTMDECVKYAIRHNPNLAVSEERVKAAKSGIGQARSNYAPKLTAKVSYGYDNNKTNIAKNHDNSFGFNVGISEMIWDFGKTTAKINMAKFDTQSAQYDHEWELLEVIYDVKINYYKVLSALANIDIYEQNVRINKLNYERTKAMFDEGLKSKIDVVNAEVNLADSKIQLVNGQNTLLTAIINLQNSMYYQEEEPFIVKNTENFNFLKADYKQKIEDVSNNNAKNTNVKMDKNKLITLSTGVIHKDIIQNYKFIPLVITKQNAVDEALKNRPDLKSNLLVTKVQEESLKSIKREYAPELNANLTWGYTKKEGSYTSPLAINTSLGFGGLNPYNVFYKIKEGEAYLDIAYHNYNISKSDIYWEVQKNYINMRQLEKTIPLMNTKVKATLENFELADGRYAEGLSNYVELQDAVVNYNKSQLNYVEAIFNYNVARETLLKSMGVGINLTENSNGG